MPAFLIEYHRPSGRMRYTRFDNLLDATMRRLDLDEIYTDPDIEVVAIESASIESLQVTHSRYFANKALVTAAN